MADATAFRLDTVDVAIECGWKVESTGRTDEFVRERVTITANYSDGDQIGSVIRRRPDHEDEVHDVDSGSPQLLRFWLTGKRHASQSTLGQRLAERRAAGNALLADPALRAGGRLVAVTLSGSGRLSKRTVDGSGFWATTDGTGVWGLCYAVKGAPLGSNQDLGCLWGMQNSYAKAAAEVAEKSSSLINVRTPLKPGSVFCCPAYIILNNLTEINEMKGLLERAYCSWVDGFDPVVG